MSAVEELEDGVLVQLAKAIGEGLTGSEIDNLLAAARTTDSGSHSTKWRRLYEVFTVEQGRSGSGAQVLRIVELALQPSRWISKAEGTHEALRHDINTALAFAGLTVAADGSLRRVPAAATLDEARRRSRRLHDELQRRACHSEVFKYCAAELVTEDYFGAVFEAVKGLGERLRTMTHVDLDGARLVDAALGGTTPRLALNSLRTSTERNEQTGVANLAKGLFSAFRNPAAHEPKTTWNVSEHDALDVLATISLVHRRLDVAVFLGGPDVASQQ